MPDYTQIRYEMDGKVARLVLNRPQYRNAQSRVLLEELDDAFLRAGDDDEVNVIVLMGAGDNFSAGHDLGTPEELADKEARPYQEGLRGRYKRSWELNVAKTLRWRNVPKPTIAAVQGYCIFGGWIISSACDVVFAASDAKFLPTNFQYFSVPWDIHPRKAKAILFESRFIDAEEAEELGYVDRIFAPEKLDEETMAYAHRVAENDPFQLRMIKMAVNQVQDTQGFGAHIQAAHSNYMLSSSGEADPGYALKKPEGRRRPMVQRAMENYERHKESQA
ncbi:MAG: enoyl-CoA hydratase/isomerase family protein [Dehalococcoidia bacterium]|nr:enoyl-CoA hydratase/isomerase family protein [Dehalococcoidia bacterium]MCA9826210.1 enoyl-CoA hydratase/isomerase family protein [Dehalococcoidia bacterium]MCA9843711.1 enoyl-CoA hydratase/isomerase family protein [Dehalococcoidia bacterium]